MINIGYITEHQFKCLWALFPDDQKLIKCAANDERSKLNKQRESPKGTLKGRRVYLDNKGAYSSGYACYENHTPVFKQSEYTEIVWDSPTPEQLRKEDIITKLKELAE